MIVFGLWLVQGLDGAPRRWSVLPSQYDEVTRISLGFVFVLAAAQVLFFWNVFQTLRGKGGVAEFDERGIPLPSKVRGQVSTHTAEGALVLLVLLLAFTFAVGGYLVGRERAKHDGGGTATTVQTSTEGGGAAAGDAKAGAAVFASAGCAGCHTLAAAGSTGTVGPVLDGKGLTAPFVTGVVTTGRRAMPAFGDQLSEEQIADVAAYVSASSQK